ncbi:hypothetical protein Ae201684P_009995 [Aphanomyces euteiches]|nr:hypothetical protein Ae201684P_009995 [Aphanomyces euteiches]
MVFKSKRALQLERARKAPRKKPKNDDLPFLDQDVMEPGMAEAHIADLVEDDSSEEDGLFMDTRPVDQADSSKWFISVHIRVFLKSTSGRAEAEPIDDINRAIEFLHDILVVPITSSKPHSTLSAHDLKRYLAVHMYLCARQNGELMIVASERVAHDIFLEKSARNYGQNIRRWADFYCKNLFLPPVVRGHNQKIRAMLCENDVQEQCRSFLRTLNPRQIGVDSLKRFLENDLFPTRTISRRSCQRFLNMLGYKYMNPKKGVYVDGHERDDVKAYRIVFLERIFNLEQLMTKYDGETMTNETKPELKNGEKEHVLIVHDESLFYSNDGDSPMWIHPKHPPLRKKGKGRCIMISEFLCECHGRMKAVLDGTELTTMEKLTPGKNEEGWWTADHLLHQIQQKMLPVVEAQHPGCVCVFLFDNSTNHVAFAVDALSTSTMNLYAGGKQPKLRDGWYEKDGVRIAQPMVMTPHGTPKGIKIVLEERGLWNSSLKLNTAKDLLASQPDFKSQKSRVEETIEATGHIALFLPKFHCEFNFIEMYWGALKYYCRENCDYSFAKLLPTVEAAMEHVTLASIRRYARKCWRYMDAYRNGLSNEQAEWAVKKQRSHRRINMSLTNKA